MPRIRAVLACLPLVVAGCAASQPTAFSESPPDWAAYLNKTVTVQGNAGNSPLGAIVRLDDGSYLPLRTRNRWGIDAVGRPVTVKGKIVPGPPVRAENFVIDADDGGSVTVAPPDQSAGGT